MSAGAGGRYSPIRPAVGQGGAPPRIALNATLLPAVLAHSTQVGVFCVQQQCRIFRLLLPTDLPFLLPF